MTDHSPSQKSHERGGGKIGSGPVQFKAIFTGNSRRKELRYVN